MREPPSRARKGVVTELRETAARSNPSDVGEAEGPDER